ncbi:hypothetical protein llap_4371 [Limosa lapponica baueri]|uniref:Uncharacterized protein n=1 Tax=Limosa lapponica baueri TaxID=1758121 RepID=A0A2I0UH10_LIMLA|nr:hypothetical protein llap_4371 [Limosa lapponica baueri]
MCSKVEPGYFYYRHVFSSRSHISACLSSGNESVLPILKIKTGYYARNEQDFAMVQFQAIERDMKKRRRTIIAKVCNKGDYNFCAVKEYTM